MAKKIDVTFHIFLRGIIMLGFAILLLSLLLTESIYFYISPSMVGFSYLATVIFFVLGLFQIFRSAYPKDPHSCNEDHHIPASTSINMIAYSLFLIPIFAGILLPSATLNSEIVANRGTQTIEPSSQEETNSTSDSHSAVISEQEVRQEQGEDMAEKLAEQTEIVLDDGNYVDVMRGIGQGGERLHGQDMDFTGFVYKDPAMNDDEFLVARFVITCCLADAVVYAFHVSAEDAQLYEMDSWVRVKGELANNENAEGSDPYVKAAEIEKIPEPDQPYVYDEFDFF
ncbi:TIGR03943 family protein [Salicibibacter cibi]|uniref:TIGR03943 family protein n=1 Tax=Salicibibacter cibi TaxID=2743001 RepID=A0A7T6ZCJ4_9BACI|nr:TIGR03943 family protein [Salicibibacter cibi]QQK80901.1 TIGR03943 family protein [Salicibibacter cibi]